MKAEVDRDTRTRQIDVTIEDGPLIDVTESWHDKPRAIRADHVTIRVVDGETRRINVSGFLVKKDGSPSDSVRAKRGWGPDGYRPEERISEAPEWVQSLFTEAPSGVTGWSWHLDPSEEVTS
jgi:hypothetical protein